MTDADRERIIQALDEQRKRHEANPWEARAFLMRLGIWMENGQLSPEYGGPEPYSIRSKPASF